MFVSVRCVRAVFVLCVHQTLGFHLGVSLFPCTLYTLHIFNTVHCVQAVFVHCVHQVLGLNLGISLFLRTPYTYNNC